MGWQLGLYKFIKKILPFAGSVVTAAFLCKYVAEYVYNMEIGGAIGDWVKGLFSGLGDLVNQPVLSEGGKLYLQTADGSVPVVDILKDSGFSIFSGTMEAIIVKVISFDPPASMAQLLIPGITLILCYVVSYAALFIALFIIIGIFNKIFAKLLKKSIFKYIDKSLGAIVWAALVVFFVYIALAILSLFSSEPVVQPFMVYLEESTVFKIMYENNVFVSLLNEIGKSFGFIK
ncbi:MAG: CvpA family protein [Clostridiales bacterium]|nr:CvpA family protein [Clostridiales bacterium]